MDPGVLERLPRATSVESGSQRDLHQTPSQQIARECFEVKWGQRDCRDPLDTQQRPRGTRVRQGQRALTFDPRNTSGIIRADDSCIGANWTSPISRHPPPLPLVRCKSYTSTLHIDLSHASHNSSSSNSYISIKPVNGSNVMAAAAAGQPRPMAANVELPPGLDTRRPSAAVIGAYRVIRRSSQMLSDSGPLLSRPAGQSPTNAAPASPLLQIATDINDSLVSARRNSSLRRFSNDAFSAAPDSYSIHSKTSSHYPDVSSKKSSTLSSPSLSKDTMNDKQSPTSSHSLSSSVLSSSPQPSHNTGDQLNTEQTGAAANTPDRNSLQEFAIFRPEKPYSIQSQPQSPDSSCPDDPHVSSESLERRRKSKMFSELREAGRQLLSETAAYVDTSGQHHSSDPTTHSPRQDNQIGTDETENSAGVNQFAADPASQEQRTKSKFLSSLYNGQEKIKNFINRGRNQLKAHELSLKLNHRTWQPTGHLENLAKEGSRKKPGDNDTVKKGNDDDASFEMNDGSLTGTGAEGMSRGLTPVTVSGGLNSPVDDDTTTTTTCETSWVGGIGQSSTCDSPRGGEGLIDDDVFSPAAPLTASSDSIHWPVRAAAAPRSHSYFEFFDLSKIKRPNSLSPASSASSSRCGTPTTLSGLNPGLISDRRRLSLPDVMEAKSKVQGALKTAADIHHKYTSGRFSPTGRSARHRSGSQHFMSDKPLTSSSSGPRSSKSPRNVSSLSPVGVAPLKPPSDSKRLKPVAPIVAKHPVSSTNQENNGNTKDILRSSADAKRAVGSVGSGDRLTALPRRSHSDALSYKGSRRKSFPVSSKPSDSTDGSERRQPSAGHHDPPVRVSYT
ncbi:hypothetical protein Btru_064157 [Bulinus truncatus]|nr:hypothetical protein Btru_064157 [Bulinus truncatus]